MSAKALAACQRGSAMIREAMAFLEQHFIEEELPEPPGWCPVETLNLLDQALGMLEPLEDEEEDEGKPAPRPRLVVDNARVRL